MDERQDEGGQDNKGKIGHKKSDERKKREHWREQQKTKRASLFLFLLITEGDDSIIQC